MITESLLRKAMPLAGARLDPHLPFIAPAMEKGGITTPVRIAAFLAQLAHESAEYRYMEEIADGSAYEGREDLGNVQPGDGPRFKGHGPIQITGRANHRACGQWLGIDAEANPLLLTQPRYGTAAAVWFWTIGNGKIDLNMLADRGWFITATRIINGGVNGLADRLTYWRRHRELLGLPWRDPNEERLEIIRFQQHHGLAADGIAGPKTLAVVKALSSERNLR
jgi:putative chitinase